MKIFTWLFVFGLLLLASAACDERDSPNCFDEELYLQHYQDTCNGTCPGICGCDNETYCNECEANKRGIEMKEEKACS